MITIGCKNKIISLNCFACEFQKFPHRCNVFREYCHMEKVTTWEWVETPGSSNIEMFSHEKGNLRVCFKNGLVYDYYEVPRRIFEEMKKAESKGKYLNANLKGKFRTVKVE